MQCIARRILCIDATISHSYRGLRIFWNMLKSVSVTFFSETCLENAKIQAVSEIELKNDKYVLEREISVLNYLL